MDWYVGFVLVASSNASRSFVLPWKTAKVRFIVQKLCKTLFKRLRPSIADRLSCLSRHNHSKYNKISPSYSPMICYSMLCAKLPISRCDDDFAAPCLLLPLACYFYLLVCCCCLEKRSIVFALLVGTWLVLFLLFFLFFPGSFLDSEIFPSLVLCFGC